MVKVTTQLRWMVISPRLVPIQQQLQQQIRMVMFLQPLIQINVTRAYVSSGPVDTSGNYQVIYSYLTGTLGLSRAAACGVLAICGKSLV